MRRIVFACLAFAAAALPPVGRAAAPVPLLEKGRPVDWWFAFKFNSASFPACGAAATRACPFGGTVQNYKAFSQQFVFASSETGKLQQGSGCAGATMADPIGATFDQVYSGTSNYAIWNDQFHNDPKIKGCSAGQCGSPWGHSKGMVAWDNSGDGLVLQVTTPSWPASGSNSARRKHDGNTLGCVKDNDVLVSQHFFALKLNKDDLVKVLNALQNASVVTDTKNRQIVRNGGPADVQQLVMQLGIRSKATTITKETLSSGVVLIAKPSKLNVPPWQLVSSTLGGIGLLTATWWMDPEIPTTRASTRISCWDPSLQKPGPVVIARTGNWAGEDFGLTGGPGKDFNHAKIGVSTSGTEPFSIFGDMNQQGTITGPNCDSSQNGRGGLFYVVNNADLHDSVTALIGGAALATH